MDDETAEIELLEQNLNKTRLISQRMTTILTSFDTRLKKLEKSILPLYNSSQILNTRATNIEKTMLKIDEVASSQEGIAAEEALILRGPQPGQLEAYKEAVERLNATIAFKASEDLGDSARLVETGAKKLIQLYTKLVAEASSGSAPPPGSEIGVGAFPGTLLATLRPLVSFLRTLPLPSSHPSHPAAPAIFSALKDAQKGYADMRGVWGRKCLETQGKRVIDRADTIDSLTAGREIGTWIQDLVSVAEDEYALLSELSPLTSPSVLSASYSSLLSPLLALFSSTMTSLIALIKKSLHKHTFLALAVYEALTNFQGRWDRLLSRRDSKSNDSSDPLKDGVTALRGVCLRSFPEFLVDLKMNAMGPGKGTANSAGELSTSIAEFTIDAVDYLARIPEVKIAVGSALLALGDGNWKMGEGVQVGKGPKLALDGDANVLVEHFLYDLIQTLTTTLSTLARNSRRPAAFNSIFLLNNIAHLRSNVIINPKNSALRPLLSKPTVDLLHSAFRTAKAGYFDSNYSPLIQALSDDGGAGNKGNAGRTATKERFTRFYDLLDEVVERHKIGKVLEGDEEGRETVEEEIVKLVVPLLQRFTQKQKDKEFSKNPQKYIKMSADEVEKQIRAIYK